MLPFCTGVFTNNEGRTKDGIQDKYRKTKDGGEEKGRRRTKGRRTKEDEPCNLVHLYDVFQDPDSTLIKKKI
jgi:hypothetical protein